MTYFGLATITDKMQLSLESGQIHFGSEYFLGINHILCLCFRNVLRSVYNGCLHSMKIMLFYL